MYQNITVEAVEIIDAMQREKNRVLGVSVSNILLGIVNTTAHHYYLQTCICAVVFTYVLKPVATLVTSFHKICSRCKL